MASISGGLLLLSFLVLLSSCDVHAQLSSSFYDSSCPTALSIIKSGVSDALSSEQRMGASLLRLHFHDCFVNGCDGSVLLDETSSMQGEKGAGGNNNSIRGFEVVDTIKSSLESACPQTVSCADILAVAARDAVVELGGPSWTVVLGRRDATTASRSAANSDLPPPTLDLSELISAFSNKGFSSTDMVALSGAHTLGQARCTTFRNRIYNEANIDADFAATRQANCPSSGSDDNLAPFDGSTNAFDNQYFTDLVSLKGLLHSDQVLFNNGSTDALVQSYSSSQSTFFSDFTSAMVKMGNLDPLTGSNGEIRINCRQAN